MNKPSGAPRDDEAQMAWLRRDLARSADAGAARGTIVFQHHMLFLRDPAEADTYHNVRDERRQILLDLFHKYGVAAVFSGHLHYCAYARAGDLQLITVGPAGKALGKDPSGYCIVRVYEDRIEHEYVPIENPATKPAIPSRPERVPTIPTAGDITQ